MKIVKTYFEDARFVDQPAEVRRHAWWALRPDGLAYHAKPAPLGIDNTESADYIVSERYPLVSC